ncbi:hypothetical protein DY000_02029779 [Brassica cretica]|uniref:Ubiquitin-like domain-containing protein n=1 Tax=Brassica cretica TaxID=69181 RepID=A0ABQ7DTN5_BRACR|nr:hypothetical protein DY000_02029779 [Brassica cretica]
MVSSSTTISVSCASKKSRSPKPQKKITVKVKTQQGGEEDVYKLGYGTHLNKLMQAYCTKRNLDEGTVRFIFGKKQLKPRSTPAQLKMKEGDVIDIVTDQDETSLRKKHDGDESEKPTLVDSVFGGEVSSTISCLECGHSSKVYEPFLDLSLPVPSKKQTLSQEERSKLTPPTKVFKNVEDSKDSSEPVSTMTFDNNQVPEIIVTQKEMEEVGSFWCESFGIEVSHNETDLVSQGGVSDNDDGSAKQKDKEAITQCSKDTASSGIDEAQVWGYPLANEELPLLVVDSQVMNMPYKGDIYYDDKTVAEGKGEKQACPIVRQTFESSTETLMPDNDGSAKPDKEAMQCSKETASSEIDEAQVWGYPDIGHSFSSAKPCADEEVPLLVADSQVLCMPYKDDKTVAEDKGETSSSYVSGHHDQQTVDYVDFSWFFEEPDVAFDDKTVRECEDEVSSSLMSSHHGKTVDYVDLNEPGVSCNAKTIKEREATDLSRVRSIINERNTRRGVPILKSTYNEDARTSSNTASIKAKLLFPPLLQLKARDVHWPHV